MLYYRHFFNKRNQTFLATCLNADNHCRDICLSSSSLLCTSAGCAGERRGGSEVLSCRATYSHPSHAWNSNYYCLTVLKKQMLYNR